MKKMSRSYFAVNPDFGMLDTDERKKLTKLGQQGATSSVRKNLLQWSIDEMSHFESLRCKHHFVKDDPKEKLGATQLSSKTTLDGSGLMKQYLDCMSSLSLAGKKRGESTCHASDSPNSDWDSVSSGSSNEWIAFGDEDSGECSWGPDITSIHPTDCLKKDCSKHIPMLQME